MQKIRAQLHAIFWRMQQLSGGRLAVVSDSVRRFVKMQGVETAATLAYYALFSLFPLMLFLAAVTSFLMENSEQAYSQTLLFFGSALPVSFSLVQTNMREIFEIRGQIGAIGLVGALWSASSFFTTLARSVNRAWPTVRLRNVVSGRLVGFAMVGVLFLLMLFSLLSSAFVNLVPSLLDTLGAERRALFSPLWRMILQIVPLFFSFLMFVALYRYVPNRHVCWEAVIKGAFITAAAWESAKIVFGYYLGSGFFNYEFLYGSIGAVMALMVWIYASCLIALFGAYLVATLDMEKNPETIAEVQDAQAAAASVQNGGKAAGNNGRARGAEPDREPAGNQGESMNRKG